MSVDSEQIQEDLPDKKDAFRPSPTSSTDTDSCHSFHTPVSIQNNTSSVSSTLSINSSLDNRLLVKSDNASPCSQVQEQLLSLATKHYRNLSPLAGRTLSGDNVLSEKNSPTSSKGTTDSPTSTAPPSMPSDKSDSHGNPEGRFPEISSMLELCDESNSEVESFRKSNSLDNDVCGDNDNKNSLDTTIDSVLEKIRTGREMEVSFDNVEQSFSENYPSTTSASNLSSPVSNQCTADSTSCKSTSQDTFMSSHQGSSAYLTQRQRIQTALDQAASDYSRMQHVSGSLPNSQLNNQGYINKMHKTPFLHASSIPRGYLPQHQYSSNFSRIPQAQSSMYMSPNYQGNIPMYSNNLSMRPRQAFQHPSVHHNSNYSQLNGRPYFHSSNSPYYSSIPPQGMQSQHSYPRSNMHTSHSMQHMHSPNSGQSPVPPNFRMNSMNGFCHEDNVHAPVYPSRQSNYPESRQAYRFERDSAFGNPVQMQHNQSVLRFDYRNETCAQVKKLSAIDLEQNINKSQMMPPPNVSLSTTNGKKRKLQSGRPSEGKRKKSSKALFNNVEHQKLVKQTYIVDALNRISSSNFQELIHDPLVTPSLGITPPKGGSILRNIVDGYEAEKSSVSTLKCPLKYQQQPFVLKYPKPTNGDCKACDSYIVQHLPNIKQPENVFSSVLNTYVIDMNVEPENPVCRTPEPNMQDCSVLVSLMPQLLHSDDDSEQERMTPPIALPYSIHSNPTNSGSQKELFDCGNTMTCNMTVNNREFSSVEHSSDVSEFFQTDQNMSKFNSMCSKSRSLFAISKDKRFPEDPITVSSLINSSKQLCCRYCEMTIVESQCIRKSDLHSNSIKSKPTSSEIVFCSVSCLAQFSSQFFNCDPFDSKISLEDIHPRSFSSIPHGPILLKRKQLVGRPPTKKRLAHIPVHKTPKKRWRGIRWRSYSFSSRPLQFYKESSALELKDMNDQITSQIRVSSDVTDERRCVLCKGQGDGPEYIEGRILNLNVDMWIHINCALWCYDVYETVSGCLMDVEISVKRALKTMCVYCGHYGAGIVCYRSRCPAAYHIPCAYASQCMFFTDRGMYCPAHKIKDHPLHLPQLNVERRVYIGRDESDQVASVVLDGRKSLRIGALVFHNVGQLLPEQLASGDFHSQNCIYPVGYKTTRFYWSARIINQRCLYVCSIEEYRGKPVFVVSVEEPGFPEENHKANSCTNAWRAFLDRIADQRRDAGLIKLFPWHVHGEDLFGLTEPHIVRAIESLPGVEFLHNYVFKFGRMQLITEMPLAVNPTGCARSEPKLCTYVRRSHCSVQSATRVSNVGAFGGLTTFGQSGTSGSHENVFRLVCSKTQQYRRLKTDWKNNISLGRSRIQGLGLFAARDLEKLTLVIEYLGETIRNEVANRREQLYEAQNRGVYMFRVDEDYIVDATICGGLARYVNHSCEPNCSAEIVQFDGRSHIIILTNKRVEKGEELTYDYNFDYEDCSNKIPCHCGAQLCRKWMN